MEVPQHMNNTMGTGCAVEETLSSVPLDGLKLDFDVLSETVHEDRVQAAITYDREFQPTTSSAGYSNESEGKKVRRTLAKYFDP